MTDKEKAEKYVSPEVFGDTFYVNCCGDWSNEDMKKAYLDGIVEGRKELEKENAELKEENKDLCESLDIMNNRESELLEQIEKMKNLYKEGTPEDKDRLCIFFDGEYYIDTFNNLSSSEQKQLIKWCYLPKITEK